MAFNETYNNVGIREELADVIWNVTPEDTPFVSNAKRVSVDSTKFEWQTDTLAAVSATVAAEGATATYAAGAATALVDNRTQINQKTAEITGTLDATERAGRSSEMTYQIVKRGKELKKDFEHTLIGIHNAKNAGSSGTARETASYATWINANFDGGSGASAAAGDGTGVPTIGTDRAFTETLLGNVIDSCYLNGGNPDVIMLNTFQKRKLSAFEGNANTTNIDRTDKKVINAVSMYESDYGLMSVVPNRIMKTDDVLVYQKDMWEIAVLRDMFSSPMAKVADSDREQIVMEAGLRSNNEQASGIIVALDDA